MTPDLFSPHTLKDVTLRNRIAMSLMTMQDAPGGGRPDERLSRDADGLARRRRALPGVPEQIAITPDGRTSTSGAGIWDDCATPPGDDAWILSDPAIITVIGGWGARL